MIVHLGTCRLFNDIDLFVDCRAILIERNLSVLIHAGQNGIGPCFRILLICILIASPFTVIIIQSRIIAIRILRQSCDHCAFTYGQLIQALSEIILCRHFDAVIGSAQINIVEIRFQNKVFILISQLFSQRRFASQSQKCLLNLTLICTLSPENFVFDQLLCNGASAG